MSIELCHQILVHILIHISLYLLQYGRGSHPVATGVGVPPAGTQSYFDGQHVPPPSQRPNYGGSYYDPQMQMGMYNHPQSLHSYNPSLHYPNQALPDPKLATNDPQTALNIPPHMQPGANANYNAYAGVGAPPSAQPRQGNPTHR